MDPVCLVEQVLQPYIAAIVSIVSRCGLWIEVCYRNQPNSKLVLYKPLL